MLRLALDHIDTSETQGQSVRWAMRRAIEDGLNGIVIWGTAGSGKSALAQWLAYKLSALQDPGDWEFLMREVKRDRADRFPQRLRRLLEKLNFQLTDHQRRFPYPVFVPLSQEFSRVFAPGVQPQKKLVIDLLRHCFPSELEEWEDRQSELYRAGCRQKFQFWRQRQSSTQVFDRLVADNLLLPIFDGLDELTREEQACFLEALEDFLQPHDYRADNPFFVLTSRLREHDVPPRVDHWEILPFSERQIQSYIEKYYTHYRAVDSDSQTDLSTQLWGTIRRTAELRPGVWDLVTNPMLLAMIALIFGSEQQEIPPDREAVYRQYVRQIWKKRNKRAPGLPIGLQMRLARLGFETLKQGRLSLDARAERELSLYRDDLVGTFLLTETEGRLSFARDMFQIYFAARYLKDNLETPPVYRKSGAQPLRPTKKVDHLVIETKTTEEKESQSCLPELRQMIFEEFDKRELHDLCFELGINFEEIAGETLSDKTRELVLYCQRRDCIPELVQICAELRPKIHWQLTPLKTEPLSFPGVVAWALDPGNRSAFAWREALVFATIAQAHQEASRRSLSISQVTQWLEWLYVYRHDRPARILLLRLKGAITPYLDRLFQTVDKEAERVWLDKCNEQALDWIKAFLSDESESPPDWRRDLWDIGDALEEAHWRQLGQALIQSQSRSQTLVILTHLRHTRVVDLLSGLALRQHKVSEQISRTMQDLGLWATMRLVHAFRHVEEQGSTDDKLIVIELIGYAGFSRQANEILFKILDKQPGDVEGECLQRAALQALAYWGSDGSKALEKWLRDVDHLPLPFQWALVDSLTKLVFSDSLINAIVTSYLNQEGRLRDLFVQVLRRKFKNDQYEARHLSKVLNERLDIYRQEYKWHRILAWLERAQMAVRWDGVKDLKLVRTLQESSKRDRLLDWLVRQFERSVKIRPTFFQAVLEIASQGEGEISWPVISLGLQDDYLGVRAAAVDAFIACGRRQEYPDNWMKNVPDSLVQYIQDRIDSQQ